MKTAENIEGIIINIHDVSKETFLKNSLELQVIGFDVEKTKLIQEKLNNNEDLLKRTAELTRVGGYEINFDTREVFWSDIVKEIHEVPMSYNPSIQEGVLFYHNRENQGWLNNGFKKALKEGVLFDIELIINTAKGNERWARVIGKPENEGGRCVKLVGAIQDIHNEKLAIEQLRRSEERYRSFIETIPLTTFNLELPGLKATYVSPQIEDLLGYTTEEFVEATQSDALNLIHPDDKEFVHKTTEEGYLSKKTFQVEYRAIHKNGTIVWLRSIAVYATENRKELLRIVVQNITDEVKSRQALEESERRFRHMADSAPVLIWMTNKIHQISYVNQYWLHFTGFEMKGSNQINRERVVHPDDLESLTNKYTEAVKNKEAFSWVYRMKSKTGIYKWFLDNAVPRYSSMGEYEGYIGTSTEITKQIKLSKELEIKQNALNQSIAEKDTLIREIHHRVKNNLQVMMGILFLKGNSILDENSRAVLTDVRQRLRAIALIHERLIQKNPLEEVSVKDYIKSLVKDIERTAAINPEYLSIELSIDASKMKLDPLTNLGFIINEVITNSIKHAFVDGRSGLIKLDLKKQEGIFHLLISDNGIGLPEYANLDNAELFGVQLVSIFAKHIKAEVQFYSDNGTIWKLEFHE